MITRVSIITPPEKLVFSLTHSTNRCCAMTGFNFVMLKACKIRSKLRTVFQFTHSIKTLSKDLSCHQRKHYTKSKINQFRFLSRNSKSATQYRTSLAYEGMYLAKCESLYWQR